VEDGFLRCALGFTSLAWTFAAWIVSLLSEFCCCSFSRSVHQPSLKDFSDRMMGSGVVTSGGEAKSGLFLLLVGVDGDMLFVF